MTDWKPIETAPTDETQTCVRFDQARSKGKQHFLANILYATACTLSKGERLIIEPVEGCENMRAFTYTKVSEND